MLNNFSFVKGSYTSNNQLVKKGHKSIEIVCEATEEIISCREENFKEYISSAGKNQLISLKVT